MKHEIMRIMWENLRTKPKAASRTAYQLISHWRRLGRRLTLEKSGQNARVQTRNCSTSRAGPMSQQVSERQLPWPTIASSMKVE